ncbi:MAG: helix-turn-helix transcriptional regulator [Actinobacteria bacterium]|nr:helix-turn-helix transcriptional regulator [Actinomycetota bacterium]
MIKCHLSRMMGERKLKIADLARETGINRGTLTRLYHETTTRIELEVVEQLCRYFGCSVCDLFEYIRNNDVNKKAF